MNDIRDQIEQISKSKSLSTEESEKLFNAIVLGNISKEQISAFLAALKTKKESTSEIVGAVRAIKSHVEPVNVENTQNLIDTCGTGGSNLKLFNISTATAFVCASAGATLAKHGNRAITSFSGSADVLQEAGANITLDNSQVTRCINELGIGFLFAPHHHKILKNVMPIRKALGFRTIFNILGPLTNPAPVKKQVIGVFSEDWLPTIANALIELGCERALIVHCQGLDEIGLHAPTQAIEINKEQAIKTFTISPEDFDCPKVPLNELSVKTSKESLSMILEAFKNPQHPAHNIIALNAGAALYISDICNSIKDGVHLAKDMMSLGLAKEKLNRFVEFTQLAGK